MRTKILLLTAALGAASLATSMAQVYSVNMVGYVNLTLIPGASFIANQVKQSPNNSVETIFASVPGSSLDGFITVSKYNGVGFDSVAYDGGWLIVGGSQTAAQMTCNPGEALYIDNASGANYTLTTVGEVATGSYPVNLPLGVGTYASPLPQAGLLESQLGFPVDTVMTVTFLTLGHLPGRSLISTFTMADGIAGSQMLLSAWASSWITPLSVRRGTETFLLAPNLTDS